MTVIAPCEWCGESAHSTVEIGDGRRGAACYGCREGKLKRLPAEQRDALRRQTTFSDMPGVAPGNALYGSEATS